MVLASSHMSSASHLTLPYSHRLPGTYLQYSSSTGREQHYQRRMALPDGTAYHSASGDSIAADALRPIEDCCVLRQSLTQDQPCETVPGYLATYNETMLGSSVGCSRGEAPETGNASNVDNRAFGPGFQH